jgi:outer membrane protein OmpA-like peptidoglycan-associated protein/tetratricopeptide (TPR) repeat protein
MMKKITILSVLCIALAFAFAQKGAEKAGDKKFRKLNFCGAVSSYEKAAKKRADEVALLEKLARSYVLSENHLAAEETYSRLVQLPTAPSANRFYYAQELRSNGKYKEAAEQYNLYAKSNSEDKRAAEFENCLEKIKALNQDSKLYNLAGLPLNSPVSEMGPAFYKDGISYTANKPRSGAISRKDVWTGGKFYDMYLATADANGNLTDSKLLRGKKANRKFHDGPATFSADGTEMYFTRTSVLKTKVGKKKQKIAKLQLLYSLLDANTRKWGKPTQLPFNSKEYSTGHPSLSADGKRLYFVSDMPGGQGETDIYVSYKEGSTWGAPMNLGANVNTAGRELFPFIAADGVLYFSSDSRVGLGGLDVYSFTNVNGVWSNVQNLGAPINSRFDDFGYIIDAANKNGYMVSDRIGGQGSDDIYKFVKLGISLCGTVADSKSSELLPGAEVKLILDGKVIATKTSGAKGNYCFNALPNKNYKITAIKDRYKPYEKEFLTGKDNSTADLAMNKEPDYELSACVNVSGQGVSVGALVEVVNLATGDKKTCTIDADCKCKFELEENSDYEICVTKESATDDGVFDISCRKITTKGRSVPASITENFEITYLKVGTVIKMYNVYFDLDKSDIKPGFEEGLKKMSRIMKRYPSMAVELSSHTDCRGSSSYNDILSTKRAKSCVDWMVKNGIDGKRIVAVGMGERKLDNKCTCTANIKSKCTEVEHQINRRTEFKILKVK